MVAYLDVLSRGHEYRLLLHGHLGALGRHVVHETVCPVLAVLVEDLRNAMRQNCLSGLPPTGTNFEIAIAISSQ